MKSVVALFAGLLFLGVAQADYQPDAQRQAFVGQFLKENPRIAKDAMWASATRFRVGVMDDGSSRDMLASAYCQDLRDAGFKGQMTVDILDIVKIKRQNKWVKLGSQQCR